MSRQDTLSRLQELAQLRDGWYDGDGAAPSAAALSLAGVVALSLGDSYPTRIYPTPSGGVCLEWNLSPWDVSAVFRPCGELVLFHALEMETDEEIARGIQAAEAGLLEGLLMTLKEGK
jgi:hypothetical protein